MTPAQLEHLKLIDAHLERLLAIAEKRTPGCWKSHVNNKRAITVGPISGPTVLSGDEFNIEDEDCDFIASCAGSAEAGWRATRAVILALLEMNAFLDSVSVGSHVTNAIEIVQSALLPHILAAFPLELIQKP